MSLSTTRPSAGDILVMVGTRKGTFLFWSDGDRRTWRRSQHNGHAPVNIVSYDERDSSLYAGLTTVMGEPVIQRSIDCGLTWSDVASLPKFEDERTIDQIWQLTPGHSQRPGEVWAGTRTAGLFQSLDHGDTWASVNGLNNHATTASWMPGGGGLILHTIVVDPTNTSRLYACVSAGGAYRSDDSGATWKPINSGVRADFLPDPEPEAGHCVHKLALHPARPQVLFQQNHCGVYRSRDAGDSWEDISTGLSSRFGFPLAMHPSDPRCLYVVPLVADVERVVPEGQLTVWRSRDEGDSWTPLSRGLPGPNASITVLREALATDPCDPAGVYVGTTTGQLYYSVDEGDHWELLAEYLPGINSVSAARVVA